MRPYCARRHLKPIDSRAIAILDPFDTPLCTLDSADDVQPMKVQVCSHTVIPPMFGGTVKVHTSASRPRLIPQHEGAARKQSVLSANGLMEVIQNRPFTILVSYFTDTPRRLHKHIIVALAKSPPDHYVLLPETVCTKAPVDAVAIVQRDELRLSKCRSACVQFHVA